jgi:polyisoprenoid-binding protein YceI
VSGTVRTDDGWPLPGAAVTVLGAGGGQAGRGATDETGAFVVPAGSGGPVTVIVAAPGMQPVARAVTVAPVGHTALGTVELLTQGRGELPPPGLYRIDPAHTIVRAVARHLGLSHVEGRFTDFSGTIRLARPVENSTVAVTIAAGSIDTGNADRDRHLRSADFLDAERFPELTFRGTRVTREAPDRGRLYGALTIRDITRDVVLDVTYTGSGPDPWGGIRMAALATTQLARRDYEMNWNMGIPGGLVVVGPTLRIGLEVQAVRED